MPAALRLARTVLETIYGQIQRNMTWVQKDLARNGKVRGIIIIQKSNKKLEFAASGTKYSIRIMEFGDFPFVQANLKYCHQCGHPNRVGSKFCAQCGTIIWMEELVKLVFDLTLDPSFDASEMDDIVCMMTELSECN